MTVREIFNKEFLFESVKKNKYPYKIFYKLDISLIKNKEGEPQPEATPEQNPIPPEVNTQAPAPVATPAPEQMAPAAAPVPEQPPVDNLQGLPEPAFSVVTEDDNEETDSQEVTDDNVIVRKLSGEIELDEEDVDNIQSIDDIYQKLQEEKNNNANILDDLSFELLMNLTSTNQIQEDLKNKLDVKKSSIFAEIIYGKKKEESVGVRLIKRKNSDLVTNSMLVDNQIVNSQFNKKNLDIKIVDMRNDEYSDEQNH